MNWAPEHCPRAHKVHRGCTHQLDWARMGSRTIPELTLMLWNSAFSAFTGEQILISNIEFHLKCCFSLSFLCLTSNKDVICRSGKETELWVETAEASCSFGADTDWYKYWSWGFCQNIHMGLDNPEKIHHSRKWPYSDEIIIKALSRATNCKKFCLHWDLNQV